MNERAEKIVEHLLAKAGILGEQNRVYYDKEYATYYAEVTYDGALYGTDEGDRIEKELRRVAAMYGGQKTDAGFGFGGRDVNFGFKNQKSAETFLTQAKKIKGVA